ncbi:acyl-[acyl-carrier-protein] thioesterase [Carboxylicivirga sp. M1479]|uniref:acyl-[acyl-carrier-protein] thioesterase n=1 Tax=Carboxylicivirga sp. M1479 TaxID=2594476 RepID=UPI001177EEA1|nr:acyl-ACP thioesterase domain-containing protein [Carboxylicivirga sp. M1479]TRX66036.1 hypothetical protein FNN09_15655 [Carboxylicivirga sp. M1479]
MDTQLQLKTKFKVSSADTDMFARLKISALANYLIQAAIESAESLGFGLSHLRKDHLFWVLNRLTIEVYHHPKWNDTIEVETWPKSIERIFFMRDFIVRDKNNRIIAKANSAWLAIDLESKRPSTFSADKAKYFTKLKELYALDYSPLKLDASDGQAIKTIAPTYFDIDLNKHVTSTRYIDWMMDHFSFEHHKNNYPKHLSINFLKETMLSDELLLCHKDISNEHYFEGLNKQQNKPAFRGKIIF